MISWNGLVAWVGVAVLISAGGSLFLHLFWQRRYRALKHELQQSADDLMQMAELQSDIYSQVSRHLHDVETRMLDLSVPASEGALPLERRHQVLTLARKGASVDEIAQRLSMPKGEVDLILSVRKFAKATPPPQHAVAGGIREYARVSS